MFVDLYPGPGVQTVSPPLGLCVGGSNILSWPGPGLPVGLSSVMSSQLVYGDGVDDIKEFFSGTFSRAGRRGEAGGLCSRPVILGAVITIWLFSLSVSLIVVASKYQNLSVVSLSSRLDNVDSRHSSNHAKALERIGEVDSHHR